MRLELGTTLKHLETINGNVKNLALPFGSAQGVSKEHLQSVLGAPWEHAPRLRECTKTVWSILLGCSHSKRGSMPKSRGGRSTLPAALHETTNHDPLLKFSTL
jgi:hypothetical protein